MNPRLIPAFRLWLPLSLLLLAWPGAAQIYKQVDEEGNVTFTDQPPPDGTPKPIELNEPNTLSAPPRNAYPARAPETEPAGGTPALSYKLQITAPANETIIPRGPGNFSVSASISPPLQAGHKLQLMLDGAPRQEPQAGTSWALTNVFRGEHAITVAVVDGSGKQLSQSEPVIVYVFRPSSNFR